MKLVAYLRVSTDEQAERGGGLDVQRAQLTVWAEREGHTLNRWESDEGISGSNGLDKRLALDRALQAIESGEVEGLVVAKLDRLARDLEQQEWLLRRIWDHGGTVFSAVAAEADILSDPNDRTRKLVRQILGAIAEYERALITMRMRSGKELRRARGGYVGGTVPYGYDQVPDPNDERKTVLRENRSEQRAIGVMRKLRRDGASLRAIAAELDRRGYKPRSADRWSAAAVAKILARTDAV